MAKRAKSRRYGKFLKFSFLKLLKMHQILKTRQLTYIPPVQCYCVTIKTWVECRSHRFLWQHTANRRDYKPQSSTMRELAPFNRVLLSTGLLKRVFIVLILASIILFICRQTLVFPTPNLFFDTSKTRKGGG